MTETEHRRPKQVGRGAMWGSWGRALLAVTLRPALWPSAARLAPPGWWRRWPPRPWPAADYIRFRTQTMYGDHGRPGPDDLVTYLEWCRRLGQRAR